MCEETKAVNWEYLHDPVYCSFFIKDPIFEFTPGELFDSLNHYNPPYKMIAGQYLIKTKQHNWTAFLHCIMTEKPSKRQITQ